MLDNEYKSGYQWVAVFIGNSLRSLREIILAFFAVRSKVDNISSFMAISSDYQIESSKKCHTKLIG